MHARQTLCSDWIRNADAYTTTITSNTSMQARHELCNYRILILLLKAEKTGRKLLKADNKIMAQCPTKLENSFIEQVTVLGLTDGLDGNFHGQEKDITSRTVLLRDQLRDRLTPTL